MGVFRIDHEWFVPVAEDEIDEFTITLTREPKPFRVTSLGTPVEVAVSIPLDDVDTIQTLYICFEWPGAGHESTIAKITSDTLEAESYLRANPREHSVAVWEFDGFHGRYSHDLD